MDSKVFAILVGLGIVFVSRYIYSLCCYTSSLGDDGWKKVREEGDFIVYSKKPWYSNKPYECRVLKKYGEPINFRSYYNLNSTNQKDKKVVDSLLKLMQDNLWEHMAYTDDTIWLYRDEIMNDEVISKVQDAFASTNYKVKIVYDWKH